MPTRDHYAAGTPCWVDLSTADAAGARDFYGTLFGWEWTEMPTPLGIPYFLALRDGARVAGLTVQPTELADAPAFWTIYLATDDGDETARRVEASGGTVLAAPDDVFSQGRMAMATDPTGAPFGVWQAGAHIGSELVDEPGAPTWAELRTSDPELALDFYCEVFDATTGSNPSDPDVGVLTVGGRGVAGVRALDTPGAMPNWSVTFAVADCDAAVEQATGAGGAVQAGPRDVGAGRMARLADPRRGSFAVIAPTRPVG